MSIFHILLRVAATIFVVEGAVMLLLTSVEGLAPHWLSIFDAVLLVALSAPLILLFVLKPYAERRTRDIEAARRQAENASRAKNDFLAHMSHELRTPLNAVIGFGQLLQYNPAEPLSATQKEYTDNIIFSGEHLLEIINGMLDLAAIEADRMHISFEDVHTKALFDDCIALLRPMADARSVTLVNDVNPSAHALVLADVVRLKQAVLNLLSNAIKYNKPGGRVTLDGTLTEDGHFRISIADTGAGISPEHFDSIFKPFDRLGIETTKPIEGTGIGLTVTQKLVKMMNGRIGFESEVGKGSTFWIEMPLAAPRTELMWVDDLSTGVPPVDEDHKVLISLVNKMSDHAISHKDVGAVIDEVLAYTLYHFEREETVMAACGYPDLPAHRIQHQNLAKKATVLADTWRQNQSSEVMAELLEFLRAWLVQHIMEQDRRIGPYAQGHTDDIERALAELAARKSVGMPA